MIHDWKELGLQSGALLLCAGESRASKGIVKVQELAGAPKSASMITHVASVDKLSPFADLMVQESTTLNEYVNKKGVQRNWLDEWLRHYDGWVWARKMEFERDDKFYATDRKFWEEHKDDPYESGIPGAFELFFCVMRLHRFIPWYTPMKTKELHCTELVSKRLQAQGLLDMSLNINRLPPWMWKSEIDKHLHCGVGEMLRIK